MASFAEADGSQPTMVVTLPTYPASGTKHVRRGKGHKVDAGRFGSQSSGRGLVERSGSAAAELRAAAAASLSAPRRVKLSATLAIISELSDSDAEQEAEEAEATEEGDGEAEAETVDFMDRSKLCLRSGVL